MKVRDVMTTAITSLSSEAVVEVAMELLIEKGLSGLPMVDVDNRLVGLITEFDLLKLYSNQDFQDGALQPCSKYMTKAVCTIQANATLDTACDVFKASKIRRLPVLEGDKLVGVLSRRDILRQIRDVHAEAVEST